MSDHQGADAAASSADSTRTNCDEENERLRKEVDYLSGLLATARADLAETSKEIAEAREACPCVRMQDFFDASLLQCVEKTVSFCFHWQSQAEQLQRKYDDTMSQAIEWRTRAEAAESRLAALQGRYELLAKQFMDEQYMRRERDERLARLTAEHEALKVGESDRQTTEMAVTPHRVPPPIAELDPGIREMVGYLWANGFETSDSGDGVTKPEDERTFGDTPHVCAMTSPLMMVSEANRMAGLLGPEWRVEASYSPRESALLIAMKQGQPASPPVPERPLT